MKQSRRIKLLPLLIVLMLVSAFASAQGTQKSIAGIVFQDDQFMRVLQMGMRAATESAGYKFYPGNSDGSMDREVELINNFIAQGVDGIAINVLSFDSSVPTLKKANDKGIKVGIAGTLLNADFPIVTVESDNVDLGIATGKKCREYIEKNLGGKATIGILRFMALLPENSKRRTDGFLSEVTKLKGVTIATQEDAWQPEQALPVTTDMITAHPDINIIWSANEGGTIGATMAVKQAGKAKSIKVFGTDASVQLANFLLDKDNVLQAVTGQVPYEIGKQTVEALITSLKGGTPAVKYTQIKGLTLSRDNVKGINKFIEDQKKIK